MRTTYVLGDSWLHRLPAGAKLAGVAVGAGALVAARSPAWLAGAVSLVVMVAVVACYLSAGLGLRTLWAQVRPLRWLLVGLMGLHLLVGRASPESWRTGATVAATIVVAVALAGLLTLTTQVSALLDTVERGLGPLRRVGVDPARVALVLALTIRAVPVVAGLATQIRDAQRARGVERSVRAYAVPLVVRSLRHADALGEALVARGLDD